jgi:exodeoxyribonuclease-1
MLNKVNLSHYELIKKIQDTFKKWSPAIFTGFNTIGFDEEFLRKTFFKSLLEPYTTQFNGNKRADVLGMTRSSKFYYPNCLDVGMNEKGNKVFKLEALTKMNNIMHNAHDAMGDVIATIEIAKILSKKANNIWKSGVNNSNKIEVDNFLMKNDIVCMDEYFFGKFNSFAVTYICKNQFNYPQCFDLVHDPIDYIDMSMKDLKAKMKLRPKIIREIKNNKNPILMDESYINSIVAYEAIGLDVLKHRAMIIKNNDDFKNKIQRILFEENEEKELSKSQINIQPEESLYVGGFPDNDDKSKMLDFYNSDWDKKIYISNQFRDQRYKYFAHRLIYEESPQTLPSSDYQDIHKIIAKQVLSTDNEKWNTIPKSYQQLDNLRVKLEEEDDDEKLLFLEDLNDFLVDLQNKYEKA